jgi:hypothetical protein
MLPDPSVPLRLAAALLATAALTLGCATGAPGPAPAPLPVPPTPVAAPTPAPAPVPPAAPAAEPAAPLATVLAYAERVRGLAPGDGAAELARLAALEPTPVHLVQTAIFLLHARGPGDTARALQLLQRVQAQDHRDVRVLGPLVRQMAAQAADQRRLEEQLDRQGQQLRDAQRRAELLQDRLDALRAIERARPARPALP